MNLARSSILLTQDQIKDKVVELGRSISQDYAGKDLLLIAIMKGAIVFIADLMREISIPVEIDFMAVSSYGSTTKTSGVVRILKDLDIDIKGKHILLVEDVIDTGLTLNYLLRNLKSREPASLEICALMCKEDKQRAKVSVEYLGFSIPDTYVVGYGLDFAQRYRNLPEIMMIEEELGLLRPMEEA